jgi:hypothetical protein
MRRAALVHKNPDVRMCADDRPGGPCVIEVDVREQNVTDVAPLHAVLLQPELECGKAGRRPGIDDGRRHRSIARWRWQSRAGGR